MNPEKADIGSKREKRGRRWRGSLLTVLCVLVLLKVCLAVGFLVQGGSQGTWHVVSPAVAEDSKSKPAQPSVAQGKLPAGAQKVSSVSPSAVSGSGAGASSDTVLAGDTMSRFEKREAEIRRREKELQQKQEYLSRMEQDIEKKLQELNALQKEVQNYRSEKEATQNAKVRSLAKIYENMKPKEAAKLLENLEEPLVVGIISTMGTPAAASILSNMETKKAAKISQALTGR